MKQVRINETEAIQYDSNGQLQIVKSDAGSSLYYTDWNGRTSQISNGGTSQYLYIRYNSQAQDEGMTIQPNENTKYLGIAVTNTSTAPTSGYTWSLIKGPQGEQGPQGTTGADWVSAEGQAGSTSTLDTTGFWKYRKWNSGKVEQWGYFDAPVITSGWSEWGSLWRQSVSCKFGVIFKGTPRYIYVTPVNRPSSSTKVLPMAVACTTDTVTFEVVGVNAVDDTYRFSVYAVYG